MKKKPLRKKSLTKTNWKKAFRNCERALIAAINRRDRVCQLADYCMVSGGCSPVLQMDHGIVSRKHKSTFFEPRQMILLCSRAHLNKTFKNHGFDVLVSNKITTREGERFVKEVINESKIIKKWTVAELEEMTLEFNSIYNEEGK